MSIGREYVSSLEGKPLFLLPISGKQVEYIWLFGVSEGEVAETERDPELNLDLPMLNSWEKGAPRPR